MRGSAARAKQGPSIDKQGEARTSKANQGQARAGQANKGKPGVVRACAGQHWQVGPSEGHKGPAHSGKIKARAGKGMHGYANAGKAKQRQARASTVA